jgi:nucleotide-binding universal stress UspA family protein
MLATKTILYPTDFSAGARPAFEVACALAGDGYVRLVVLHVERPPLATLGGTTGVPPLPNEYGRQKLEEELKGIQPARAGIAVAHRLEYGDPATVILKVTQEIGADLIVMCTHGRTGLRRLLMGSVAEQVMRKAPCPVLTVGTPVQTSLSLPAAAEEVVSS